MDVSRINVLVLAYLGDNIYEYYVRKFLINEGIANVNDLQSKAVSYVSAVNQAKFLDKLVGNDLLSDFEIDVVKRARNHKCNSHPKNCDIITYKHATALEALLGYLELTNDRKRIEEIMDLILGGSLC